MKSGRPAVLPRTAVYPGTFDPVTNGHVDILNRALGVFDRVTVAVLDNPVKSKVFSVEERVRMLRESVKGRPRVEVDHFSGLLVDYMRRRGMTAVIRGLRVVSDLDYEFQIASMNRRLYPAVETVFLMPDERFTYLSSSMVREIAMMGGNVSPFVPQPVARLLKKKFG